MPFNVDSPNPADDAIVSQFPANERSSRTNIEDWMNFEHSKTTGRHKIPTGNTTARDAITEWTVGSMWFNTTASPGVLQIVVSTGPFVWADVVTIPSGLGPLPYAGATIPAGWLLCDGAAVSRTTYASLFTAIGTTWGAGDGSTTFNLPDMRGRAPFGKDDMGGTAANRITNAISGITGTTLGAVGGDQRQQSHTHTGTSNAAGNHTHNMPQSTNQAGGPYPGQAFSGTNFVGYNFGPSDNPGDHTHTFTTASTGAGASQNMPPTAITNYIIKT